MNGKIGAPKIILDLSRLLSRVLHPTPTGVDRCEMAYARGLLAEAADRLSFAAVHPLGGYGNLDRDAVLRFLDVTEERWARDDFRSGWERRRFVASTLIGLRPRSVTRKTEGARVYIQASPNNLTRPELMQRILSRQQARFLCLVHDLIPLEFPEYGRDDGASKHRARIETIVRYAHGIIANSAATLASLIPWVEAAGHSPACRVAHLGVHPYARPSTITGIEDRPYFVCIGTIEPRKNHLLLLQLWRRLSERFGAKNIPKLILIGRRGWENEQVIDLLERSVSLKDCVEERNGLADIETAAILAGARALLLPSFAEGYGMPVTEAMSLKVPVICSDIPSLREAGDGVPEFLDPLDGPAWAKAILEYVDPASPRRARQAARLAKWVPPTWKDHMKTVLELSMEIAR